jgi:glycosyltransferase involved in cell wall biosynthesis
VATDVGACREILFGRRDEKPQLGDGGILTDMASPGETARAIAELLGNSERRVRLGRAMQERVRRYYDIRMVEEVYATIYQTYCPH